MQIRCYNCHRPYSLSKETIIAALDDVHSENLTHYNAPCPHCRKTNRVSPKELKRSAPGWKPESTEE